MLGFVSAAFVITYMSGTFSWRFTIQVQALCEIPIAIGFLCSNNELIDVLHFNKHPEKLVSFKLAKNKTFRFKHPIEK